MRFKRQDKLTQFICVCPVPPLLEDTGPFWGSLPMVVMRDQHPQEVRLHRQALGCKSNSLALIHLCVCVLLLIRFSSNQVTKASSWNSDLLFCMTLWDRATLS